MNTGIEQNLAQAISEWRSFLSADQLVTDQDQCLRLSTTTYQTTQSISAVLYPKTLQEVQSCVRIAAKHRVALYPVSTGKNWGYGSCVPTHSGSVVVHLSRMKQIVEYNESLGYVTLEPGVTQQQLFDFLQEKRSGYWMDATGASPDCSVIGNTVERGFGHTPYGDHFNHVCALEVVLADGNVITSGFGPYENAQSRSIFRWGVGPVLDGLFTQSNFGIVTRMTLWLMPAPETFEAFYFKVDEDQGLAAVIDAMRPLRLRGVLPSAIHIGNDYKVLNAFGPFPWEETHGSVPLSPEKCRAICRAKGIGAWNGSGALYGSPCQVKDAKRKLKQALKGKVQSLQFLNDTKLNVLKNSKLLTKILFGQDAPALLNMLVPIYGLKKGIPTDAMIDSLYWRKRGEVSNPLDPDADGCGLMWLGPVIPLDGAHGAHVTKMTYDIMLKHSFEPMISLTMLTERAMDSIISIIYDRSIDGEDARAKACHDDLFSALKTEGYIPYRLGIHNMNDLPVDHLPYGRVLKTLKDALDPEGILAPGRYELRGPQE